MPYEFRHRRKVDDYEARPFFNLTVRNIVYFGLAGAIAIGVAAWTWFSNLSPAVMTLASFVIMGVCGPLAFAGYKKPKDSFNSYEQKALLIAKHWFTAKKLTFKSDSVFWDTEDTDNVQTHKSAKRNARREREQRG